MIRDSVGVTGLCSWNVPYESKKVGVSIEKVLVGKKEVEVVPTQITVHFVYRLLWIYTSLGLPLYLRTHPLSLVLLVRCSS